MNFKKYWFQTPVSTTGTIIHCLMWVGLSIFMLWKNVDYKFVALMLCLGVLFIINIIATRLQNRRLELVTACLLVGNLASIGTWLSLHWGWL